MKKRQKKEDIKKGTGTHTQSSFPRKRESRINVSAVFINNSGSLDYSRVEIAVDEKETKKRGHKKGDCPLFP